MMFVQGRTHQDAIVICDEAQNLNEDGMKMLVTRLGKNSKMMLCGDLSQSLLKEKEKSGLKRMSELSGLINEIGVHELTTNWRHPIVEKILNLM